MRIVTLWVSLLFSLPGFSQFSKEHGVRSMATFSPGVLLSQKSGVVSLSGNFNYYLQEQISFQGEGSYFLANLDKSEFITKNHQLFGGFSYHFLSQKRTDLFLGLHPGVSFFQSATVAPTDFIILSKLEVIPLISFSGGLNYYVGSIFHFLLHIRYVQGQAFTSGIRTPLSELRFMAGLGFNLGVK